MTVITCGVTHLIPLVERITQAIRDSHGFKQSGGCGVDFDMDNPTRLNQMYRCVECGRWLCKPCILRHFSETSDHTLTSAAAVTVEVTP